MSVETYFGDVIGISVGTTPYCPDENVQNCLSYETITCNILSLEKHFGGISRKVESTHIENCLSAGGIIAKSGK